MAAKYLIGVDEVGRGPLAGPVGLGVVAVAEERAADFARLFDGVRDSKQLTAESRERWQAEAARQKAAGLIDYAVCMIGNEVIDSKGLSFAIRFALARALRRLDLDPSECRVFLDGGLKAPPEYARQETIIKGDQKVQVISLASIVAKVERDARMEALSRAHPGYGFEAHKGYGTAAHLEAIRAQGLCPIHRRSFLRGHIEVVDCEGVGVL